MVNHFHFSHSSKCVVVYPFGFISIFLKTGDMKDLICLLVIHISYEIIIFSGQFLIRLFVFLLLNHEGSLFLLDISPLLDMCFTNIFSESGLSFHFNCMFQGLKCSKL